eukprot:432124_1
MSETISILDKIIKSLDHETIEENTSTNPNTEESTEPLEFEIYASSTESENETNNPDIYIPSNSCNQTSKQTSNDVGSRTMEQWLHRKSFIVHPTWIGNLPIDTTTTVFRKFVETHIGRVIVSLHVNKKKFTNTTYGFMNLPTAEKQLLAVTLLDNKIFMGNKLIVRPSRPSKFNHTGYNDSLCYFKHFKDILVPLILHNAKINLNVAYIRKIIEQNRIKIDHLPSRVFSIQCQLLSNCCRSYCPFYHCYEEKEIGRIIAVLSATKHSQEVAKETFFWHKKFGNILRNGENSKHILSVQCVPRCVCAQDIKTTFENFGDIDKIIMEHNYPFYIKMKRAQDARKIVVLWGNSNDGMFVGFAKSGASEFMNWWFDERPNWICYGYVRSSQKILSLSYAFPMALVNYIIEYYDCERCVDNEI